MTKEQLEVVRNMTSQEFYKHFTPKVIMQDITTKQYNELYKWWKENHVKGGQQDIIDEVKRISMNGDFEQRYEAFKKGIPIGRFDLDTQANIIAMEFGGKILES